MKKEEKLLFRQLCSFDSGKINPALLRYATPRVLGQLFYNRMQSIAYGELLRCGCLGQINREFRNALKGAYEQSLEKNKSFIQGVKLVSYLLQKQKIPYAMLKGAVLCGIYPKGYRTANDIDLLVSPENVTELGRVLSSAGFLQGYLRGETFIPASRKEIVASKMLRGETVPYVYEIGLPKLHYLEVDLNFSLSAYSARQELVLSMLNHRTVFGGIPTLAKTDFFIHLCCHLYKEASTMPWVAMKRDMTLYKYADIYMLLNRSNKAQTDELSHRAKELKLEKICAFAILQTAALFDLQNQEAMHWAKKILENDAAFLHRVISPREKKSYQYRTTDIEKRFFLQDRLSDLEEAAWKS